MKDESRPRQEAAPAHNNSTEADHNAAAHAATYIRRGWGVTPLRGKKPFVDKWQKNPVPVDEIEDYWGDGRNNIGILTGEISGNLIDLDLDCDEARSLADRFLPPTECSFGKSSTPNAHRLFRCVTHFGRTTRFNDVSGNTILEVRGDRAQSMAPPSIHPDGGAVTWNEFEEPARVRAGELKRTAGRAAAAVLLARHWPHPHGDGGGSRHDASLAMSGALVREGWSVSDVENFVVGVAEVGGDDDVEDRVRAVQDTVAALERGDEVTGWPTIEKIFAMEVASRANKWLGVKTRSEESELSEGSGSLFYFDDVEPFHPAQHFTDTTAYYGVGLEKDVEIKSGPDKGNKRRAPVLAIVTSDRQVFEARHGVLAARQLRYSREAFPAPPESRFRPSAVKRWLDGEIAASPAALYVLVCDAIRSRVDFPHEGASDLCALFSLGTYVFRIFDTFPYLVFRGSSTSGKSKTAKVVGSVAFNSAETTSLTVGAIYLEVEAHGATLILDDAEDLGDDEARTVKSVLNAGYKRGGSALRGDWEAQASRRYSVYGPKVITSIRGVDSTLRNRCIVVDMQPSLNSEILNRSEDTGAKMWATLRDDIYFWALSDWVTVRDFYLTTTPSNIDLSLSGRSWERWRPLFALARYFEARGVEGLVDRLKGFATADQSAMASEQVDSREGLVLSFLWQEVQAQLKNAPLLDAIRGETSEAKRHDIVDVTPKILADELVSATGDKVTPGALGWTLKRLGFDHFKSRAGGGGRVRYSIPLDAIREAARRRNINLDEEPNPSNPSQPSQPSPSQEDMSEGSEGSEDDEGFPQSPEGSEEPETSDADEDEDHFTRSPFDDELDQAFWEKTSDEVSL
jgi:hypothetical protein